MYMGRISYSKMTKPKKGSKKAQKTIRTGYCLKQSEQGIALLLLTVRIDRACLAEMTQRTYISNNRMHRVSRTLISANHRRIRRSRARHAKETCIARGSRFSQIDALTVHASVARGAVNGRRETVGFSVGSGGAGLPVVPCAVGTVGSLWAQGVGGTRISRDGILWNTVVACK